MANLSSSVLASALSFGLNSRAPSLVLMALLSLAAPAWPGWCGGFVQGVHPMQHSIAWHGGSAAPASFIPAAKKPQSRRRLEMPSTSLSSSGWSPYLSACFSYLSV